jgi:hypothetical protein
MLSPVREGSTVDCEFLLCERGGGCRDEVVVR